MVKLFLFLFSLIRPRFALIALAPFFWVLSAQPLAANAEQLDEMRALAHSRLPVLALLNQGAALLYSPARRALEEPGPEGLRAFGGFMGGRQEFSSAGQTKVDGFSFMAGLGRRFTIEDSPLAAFNYGFFGEGGTGRFEALPSYEAGEARLEGRGRYVGGGFLLKAEFQNRFYMDGAFRVGQASSSLDTFNLDSNPKDRPDDSSTYFGAAGTVGWLAGLCDLMDLDIYSRLLWSSLGTGEKRTFGWGRAEAANLNSTRFILGTRADFWVGEGRLIYAGAAWEHEFNGRAELKINDRQFKDGTVTLKGDSLVGELGLELGSAEGISARFGLEGALGQREALGGLLRLSYVF